MQNTINGKGIELNGAQQRLSAVIIIRSQLKQYQNSITLFIITSTKKGLGRKHNIRKSCHTQPGCTSL